MWYAEVAYTNGQTEEVGPFNTEDEAWCYYDGDHCEVVAVYQD